MGLLYFIVVSLVNSFDSAVSTFFELWYWIIPIVGGFGIQVALFAYGRSLAKAGASPHASGVMASGGASAVSMLACCSHYISNVLPLLGVTGLSLILSNYQSLFLLAGLLSNVLGIVYLMGVLGRHRLYASERMGLGRLAKWPIHRAVPYVAGFAGAILLVAILVEVFK